MTTYIVGDIGTFPMELWSIIAGLVNVIRYSLRMSVINPKPGRVILLIKLF